MFINASDILLYMLFNLFLANITILLCFSFLFFVIFNSFCAIPVQVENVRLKIALVIPAGAPMTVTKYAIENYPLLQIKQLMTSQISQKKQYVY